ncbi:uncharacterized protein LOC134189316 isoform X1 [Corticium candelabrum]|uniref:uncharacterized protein LOC134189316 isoform X1 n=1 Tax=Corticium candelabrum TaxID=121492 RepID=UPI002E26DB27|nr:uncharacterized protein LOC134189316 isoform X1 [Corticium candelabrum]
MSWQLVISNFGVVLSYGYRARQRERIWYEAGLCRCPAHCVSSAKWGPFHQIRLLYQSVFALFLCACFGSTFQESVEKMKNLNLKLLQRAFHSINGLIKRLLFLVVNKKLQLGVS